MNRRFFLSVAPASGVALALTSGARPSKYENERKTDQARMIRVIEQLETVQGWEKSSVIAAKAFAAWQMRKALCLNLPAPDRAQMHVDFQHQEFVGYRRSAWFERDRDAGKVYDISPMERGLT